MPTDHIIHNPENRWLRWPTIVSDPDVDTDRVPDQNIVVSVDGGDTVCLHAGSQEIFASADHAYELGQFLVATFKPKKRGRK